MPKMTAAQKAATTRDASVEDTDDGSPEAYQGVPAAYTPPAKKPPTYGQKGRTSTSADLFGSLEEDTDYIKWLMYGPQGSGKTTAACKAANHGKILVLRAEGGLKKMALASHGIDVSNIMVFPKQQGRRIRKADLIAVHEQLLADLEEDPDSWFAVVLDSVTEIHHTLREDATHKRVEKVLNRLTDPKLIAEFDEDFIDRDDYGAMTGQLREILRDFRDLPCHVIMTALQRVDDKTDENVPAITPALRIDLMGYVDVLTAHKGEDDSFRALTRATDKTHAKDRFNVLPKVWTEPDFDRLLQYMGGEFTTGGDDLQDAFDRLAEEVRVEAEAALAAKLEAKKTVRSGTRRTAAKKPADTASANAETGE